MVTSPYDKTLETGFAAAPRVFCNPDCQLSTRENSPFLRREGQTWYRDMYEVAQKLLK